MKKPKPQATWGIMHVNTGDIMPFAVCWSRRDMYKYIRYEWLGKDLKKHWKQYTAIKVTLTPGWIKGSKR